MPKDTKSSGYNKAPACESRGFGHKKEGENFDTPSFRKIFISRMSHKRKLSRILSHRIKGKLSLWTFGQRGVVLAVIPLLL